VIPGAGASIGLGVGSRVGAGVGEGVVGDEEGSCVVGAGVDGELH
jgi:hypothetical protein